MFVRDARIESQGSSQRTSGGYTALSLIGSPSIAWRRDQTTLKASHNVVHKQPLFKLDYGGHSKEFTNNVAVFGGCGARFRQKSTLEDAIGSHACSLEALTCV
jgi:hypothetical protein